MGCNSSISDSPQLTKKDSPRCIFITGSPGSGKRTQCRKIVDKYGFKLISIAELLREEIKRGSEEGQKIQILVEQGKLVSSEVVIRLIQEQMVNKDEIYLIEGFPKNMENVEVWNKICVREFNLMKVFYFHCQTHILQERLKNRQASTGRIDDAPAIIEKRIATYNSETRQVVQFYDNIQKCIHVNSERSPEAVFTQICQQVEFMLYKIDIRLPEILFISGQLASGKRTQAKMIQEKYGYDVIVTNEVLKEAVAKADDKGKKVKDLMESGIFVPSEIVVDLLIQKIDSLNNRYFVIEGFPKNQENIDTWNRKTINIFHTKLFFFFDVEESLAMKRLEARSSGSEKPEDQISVIKKRMQNFSQHSGAVLKYFEGFGKLYRVDCNRPQDSVFRQICLKIDEQLYFKKIELPRVIFICGGPGAGKGTQCAKMKETFGFEHYSTGDLLRAEVASGSELSAQIKEVQDAGKLVSSELLIDIVKAQLEYKKGIFMLDGFPRSQESIDIWEKKMKGVCNLEYLIYFECEQSAMEERMLERAKTSGGSDDNPETIKKRLVTFFEQTKPIIEYYRGQKKLISINADRDIEAIFNSVKDEIQIKILNKKNGLPDVFFVNGGPGVGKRTLCYSLAEKHDFVHLNVGELLKQKGMGGGAVGNMIKSQMSQGLLVDSETVVALLRDRIGCKGGRFIVDGFPKSYSNLDQWNKVMLYSCNLGPTILLDCEEEIMMQRLRESSGGESKQALRRMEIFKMQTMILIPGFQKHGDLRRIDVSKLTQEQVFQKACEILI